VIARIIGAALALALVSGCQNDGGGTDPETAPISTPSVSPLPESPPCAAETGELVPATTSEGDELDILLLGAGPDGVVLLPQDDGDICQWLAYGQELAETYRVALADWADPRSEVAALAADALRAAGADDVVLGGASFGGATVMSEAHEVQPAPAGVFSLGGELTLPGQDFRPGIRQWRGPLLQISSREDFYFDSADAARLRALHPGPETIVMLPGSTHGVDLLEGRTQGRVRAELDGFLQQVLG